MAKLPSCKACGHETKLIGENDTHWAFQCRFAHPPQIFSKPREKGKAAFEASLNTADRNRAIDNSLARKRSYSFSSRTSPKRPTGGTA